MASPVYPGSMISRGVSWSSSLSLLSGCLSYAFISASSSRHISIKIKWGRDLRIPHHIYFTREEPKFQYPIGNSLQPNAIPKWACVCSDPNPTVLSFLMPSFWHLSALSHKPQEEISDETVLRKYALLIATDTPLIYLGWVWTEYPGLSNEFYAERSLSF